MSTSKFKQIEILYKEIISSVSDPQNYFSSNEYFTLNHLAGIVFDKVWLKCEIFLEIVCGAKKGSEIGHPDIERGLCFPSRFLNVSSTADLPDTHKIAIEDIIENTFFLGLMCHLFLHTFPTRGDVKRVNMDVLIHEWGLEALIADMRMKNYSRNANELPLRIFESFFRSKIEPTLKKHFKIGFWKLGKCRSFFKNLFFSGALLGMMFDLMTSK